MHQRALLPFFSHTSVNLNRIQSRYINIKLISHAFNLWQQEEEQSH